MRKLLVLLGGVAALVGCGSEDTVKTSHFEHDHNVAHHWPDGLADAAAKIRERLGTPGREHVDGHHDEHNGHDGQYAADDHPHGHDHRHRDHPSHEHDRLNPSDELADLVSWIPEIAADTNLTEQDWMILDNAARSLSAELSAAGNELTKSNRQQALELCELIEQSLPKIPDQLPSLGGTSP